MVDAGAGNLDGGWIWIQSGIILVCVVLCSVTRGEGSGWAGGAAMRTPCMLIAAMLAVPLDALVLAPLPTPRSAACARTRTPMLKDGDGLNNGLGGAM